MEAARDADVNTWQCLVGNFNIFGNFCLRKWTTIDGGFMINFCAQFFLKKKVSTQFPSQCFKKKSSRKHVW
jgi:hypothetical protein